MRLFEKGDVRNEDFLALHTKLKMKSLIERFNLIAHLVASVCVYKYPLDLSSAYNILSHVPSIGDYVIKREIHVCVIILTHKGRRLSLANTCKMD